MKKLLIIILAGIFLGSSVALAQTATINVRVFYDKDEDGNPDNGEIFDGTNPLYSSSVALVFEFTSAGDTLELTSLLNTLGYRSRTVDSNKNYYYSVRPITGSWKLTKYAVKDPPNPPSGCTFNSPYYICPYIDGNIPYVGNTKTIDPDSGNIIEVWLGVDSLVPITTTTLSCTSACGAWQNTALCGTPWCIVANQRYQTRTCPASSGCYTTRCVSDPICQQTTTPTTIPQSQIAYACNDPDGGLNYFVSGNSTQLTFVNNVLTNINTTSDVCITSTLLTEKSCQNNQTISTNYICPEACSNGACVASQLPILGSPDFIVHSPISISPPVGLIGYNVSFGAVVENLGTGSNYTGVTRFRIDLNNDGSWNVVYDALVSSVVTSGTSISLWPSWTAVAGNHTVEACADVNNIVAETNENNNCETEVFSVGGISGNQTTTTTTLLQNQTNTTAQTWNWMANANSNYSTTLLSWSSIATVPSNTSKIAIAVWGGEEEKTLNGNQGNYDIVFIGDTCTRSKDPWSDTAEGECIVISNLNNDFTFDNTYPVSSLVECDIRYTASTRSLEFRDTSTLEDCGFSVYALGGPPISASFIGSDFECERIQNRNTCTLDYQTNTTGLIVLFTSFDNNSIVLQSSNTLASSNSGVAIGNFFCSSQTNRTVHGEWIVYTDATLSTPIRWVKSNEIIRMSC